MLISTLHFRFSLSNLLSLTHRYDYIRTFMSLSKTSLISLCYANTVVCYQPSSLPDFLPFQHAVAA